MDSLTQAKRESETVVKLAGDDSSTYKTELAEAYGMIGLVLLLEKKYPEAIAALNTSIRLVDDNPQRWFWRAQAFTLAGRRDEAIRDYEIVLRLDPKHQEAQKHLKLLTQK
jgi:tetratricopeptide (TPR) repeat protein